MAPTDDDRLRRIEESLAQHGEILEWLQRNFQTVIAEPYRRGRERQAQESEQAEWRAKHKPRGLRGGLTVAAVGIGTGVKKVTDHPTASVAAIAIVGLGFMVMFRPGSPEPRERVVAGPTATVTRSLPINSPSGTPPATTRAPSPVPTDGRTNSPTRSPGATDGAGVLGDREPNEAEQPTATRTEPGPTTTRTRTAPTVGPTSQPEPEPDCIARAKVLGINVELLCT